ncbi:hypothetical protein WJ968_14420 [Achromobacter xylosoxidans]
MLDLGMNLPPPPQGCDMQELLRRGLARVMERRDVHVLMTYQLAGGSAAERAAGAQWLSEAAEPVRRACAGDAGSAGGAGRRDPGLRPGRRRHRFRAAGLSRPAGRR